MTQVLQDRLTHDLGAPVNTLGLEGSGLRDRNNRRDSVYGRTARVDELSAAVFLHNLGEQDRGRDVVGIVGQGDLA